MGMNKSGILFAFFLVAGLQARASTLLEDSFTGSAGGLATSISFQKNIAKLAATMDMAAANNILVSGDSSLSPYQILEQLHAAADRPASLEDFDLNTNAASNQKCTFAVKDRMETGQIRAVRASYVVRPAVPAVPSAGPLFPSKPAIPAQLATTFLLDVDSADADRVGRKSMFTTEGRDLIVTTLVGASLMPVVLNIRKNGDLIAIQITGGGKIHSYCYCYRQ